MRSLPITMMITGSSLMCSTVVTNGQTKSIQSHLAMTFHLHRDLNQNSKWFLSSAREHPLVLGYCPTSISVVLVKKHNSVHDKRTGLETMMKRIFCLSRNEHPSIMEQEAMIQTTSNWVGFRPLHCIPLEDLTKSFVVLQCWCHMNEVPNFAAERCWQSCRWNR
jgi:hypothetical protein